MGGRVRGPAPTRRRDAVTPRATNPKDHAERVGLYEGAPCGLSPAARPDRRFPHVFAHVTPIDGPHLAGQTTYPGFGVVMSMPPGVFAAGVLASRALH